MAILNSEKISQNLQKIGSANKNIDNSVNLYDIVKKKIWLLTDAQCLNIVRIKITKSMA